MERDDDDDGETVEEIAELSSIRDPDRFTLSSPVAASNGGGGGIGSPVGQKFGEEAIDRSSLVQVAESSGIQESILAMVGKYLLPDAEILALGDLQAPATDDCSQLCEMSVTQILDVVPGSGTVLPYSSEYAYLVLDAPRRLKIDAKLACRVESGPTETTHVRAFADTIRYSIDEKCIDFHHQLIGKTCHATLTIANRGIVGFGFETHFVSERSQPSETRQTDEITASVRLRVAPRCGMVEPMSKTHLDVACYLDTPGEFYKQFDLEIARRTLVSIRVKGYGSLPQVYLTAPRSEAFKRLPVQVFYHALGSLTTPLLTRAQSLAAYRDGIVPIADDYILRCRQIPRRERERLAETGWEMISHGQILPSAMDVEMAVERLVITGHVRENPYILGAEHRCAIKTTCSLFVPEYTIDFGYVIIERVGCYSTMLINYGPTPIDVCVRKDSARKKLGIDVQFRRRHDLPAGESTPLNVTFRPTRSTYTENRTDVEHTIYLEVTGGYTIPISVRAVATYPFLTADTVRASFKDVAVGNCVLMPIILRNE